MTHIAVACVAFLLGLWLGHSQGTGAKAVLEPPRLPSPKPEKAAPPTRETGKPLQETSRDTAARPSVEPTMSDQRKEAPLSKRISQDSESENNRARDAAFFGLTEEYVKDFPRSGLTGNLIVTTEGQILYHMTSDQVRQINAGLRQMRQEFREWEARNARVRSETRDEIVLVVPPYEKQKELREKVTQLLCRVLGESDGNRFLNDNMVSLVRPFSGFGSFERVVTISNRLGPRVEITEQFIDPSGHVPFSGNTSVAFGKEVPWELRHLFEVQNK